VEEKRDIYECINVVMVFISVNNEINNSELPPSYYYVHFSTSKSISSSFSLSLCFADHLSWIGLIFDEVSLSPSIVLFLSMYHLYLYREVSFSLCLLNTMITRVIEFYKCLYVLHISFLYFLYWNKILNSFHNITQKFTIQ